MLEIKVQCDVKEKETLFLEHSRGRINHAVSLFENKSTEKKDFLYEFNKTQKPRETKWCGLTKCT